MWSTAHKPENSLRSAPPIFWQPHTRAGRYGAKFPIAMAIVRARTMNGVVLTWARERMKLSAGEVAELLKQDESTVVAWEAGSAWPTLRQLERVAELLRMPLAVFFFPVPPEVAAPTTEFRMLPEPGSASEAKDTAHAINEAAARQLSVLELGLQDRSTPLPLSGLAADDPLKLRERLGISLTQQISWGSAEEAFKAWRAAIEALGVFVFKRSIKQRSISGFCLPHPEAPVIVVNNSTTWTRQIFTLFHELAHLLHHHHGVTRADFDFNDSLPPADAAVEVQCNRFAAEFLLPPAEFNPLVVNFTGTLGEVETAAQHYKISREVILRRLRDLGRVTQETYETWTRDWTQTYFARPKPAGGSGGNYYATTVAYLGDAFLNVAFKAYERGRIQLPELAAHLGVKGRSIPKLALAAGF